VVDDIHRAALAYADQLKPLDKGAFAGKSLKQAMETADTADLNRVLDFVVKYPRDLAGKRLKLSTVYALWLQNGTP
jgi:hypothetical protein